MATAAVPVKYQGGACYAMCQDTFSWYNASIAICWKGCDYGTGRVNDPAGREEANNMCKRYTSEIMWTNRGELGSKITKIKIKDSIEDLRVHSDMFPENPQNIYRACLAGIRRQKY